MLVNVDRGVIVLPGEHKGKIAVLDQCNAFAIRCVNGVNLVNTVRLLSDIRWQISHAHRSHIDGAFSIQLAEIKLGVHTINPRSTFADFNFAYDGLRRSPREIHV